MSEATIVALPWFGGLTTHDKRDVAAFVAIFDSRLLERPAA